MKKGFALLYSVVLAGVLFSCQKEVDGRIDDDIDPDPVPAGSDTTRLSKFVELDTTQPSGADTMYKREYFYDVSKRVKEVRETEYSDVTYLPEHTIKEYRFYNGTDTVPHKVVRDEWYDSPETFQDTIYLTYNSSNVVVKDSMIHYMDGSFIAFITTRFISLGGNNFLVKRTTDNGIPGFIKYDSILSKRTISAANVTAGSDSVYVSVPPAPYDLYSSSFYTFSYDNKPNPFKRVLLRHPVTYFDAYNIIMPFGYPLQPTANNPLTWSQEHNLAGGVMMLNGSARYEYNSTGYPVIIRYTDHSVIPRTYKGLLFYTRV